ncbi:toprim domain-containing protein [Pedobacter sp. B4-66]|uniref:toprim domain-containing protein n=1 Tax=Pedobacter sp. B4-66 TaxID=2817280 RepID=UPI001BDB0546|nr:toprim domain-containing protein [Pedobacter sp. B4-66]
MEKKKALLTCDEAKQMDMVAYLSQLGLKPVKVTGSDHWYHSPLRNEKSASFKINAKLNRWYDFGLGKGGNLVDFGTLFFGCTVTTFLQRLEGNTFPPVQHQYIHNPNRPNNKIIEIVGEQELQSFALLEYLRQRCIPVDLARIYCKEVRYKMGEKTYYGIGFQNNSGGYEIRNPFFKSSSSPKDITTILNGGNSVAVFEGFFDFLSYLVLSKNDQRNNPDFLILNSLAFFEKAKTLMESYGSSNLYLDGDAAGQKMIKDAISANKQYIDESNLYREYQDLNNYLCNNMNPQKITQEVKRGLSR